MNQNMENDLKKCRVLLVDDTKTNVDVLVEALREDYKLGVALDGAKALEYASVLEPDLILLDVMMPGMDGFEVCSRLQTDPGTREIPIIFITARDAPEDKANGFTAGAVDYITKPFDIAEVKARVKTHLLLKMSRERLAGQNQLLEEKVWERTRELEATQKEIIDRLGRAAEYRDEETGTHIKRMSEMCGLLGKAAGLDRPHHELLALASTMHDVGKIGICDSILLNPGKLSPEEFEIMKNHTLIGGELLSGGTSKFLEAARMIAETHHEKWDGSGYPKGISGENIPLFGRIACICDVFDALISKRSYKRSWPFDEAVAELVKGRGAQFDPTLVDLFVSNLDEVKAIVDKYAAQAEGSKA